MGRNRRIGARSVIAWSAAVFVALQVALNLTMECREPEIYDAEYRDRLCLLRERALEQPDRPLLVVVGSSRMITDFRPEVLPPLQTPQGEGVLTFNLSHSGAGPLFNLVAVRRLLRAGFHPRWLVIEVVPPLLGASGQSTVATLAEAEDLPLMARYVNRWKLAGYYAWARLTTCFTHRDACLRSLVPWCMARPPVWDAIPLDDLGGTTSWLDFQTGAQDVARRTAVVRSEYFPGLQRFHIAEAPDRAMRETLDLCRKAHVAATILLAPESSAFRSWYSKDAELQLRRYCEQLSRDYDIALVDSRHWLPDDAFMDGHHVFPEAAERFTLRLGREALEPLVYGVTPRSDCDSPAERMKNLGRRRTEAAASEECEIDDKAQRRPPSSPER